jgi:Tfp pilus assembly protein PilX
MRTRNGQLLVGAILLMAVLAILIPVLVTYIQNETRWSEKQTQNSNAFQLAEAALDRGYQRVTESTAAWAAVQKGLPLPGFAFDAEYKELPGGSYAVSVASGPGSQTVTIIGAGRDSRKKEVRALKAVYANAPMSGNAIQGGNTVNLSGTNEVEWGPVVSPKTITLAAGTNHPQFYSAGNITNKDPNGSSPPNTDGLQWWSYYPNIPPAPFIDFDAYLSSAIATGTCISEVTTGKYTGCVNSGQNKCGGGGWAGGGDHDCNAGPASKACKNYTWYINCPTKGVDITSNNQTWVIGTLIVIGNLTVRASAASGAPMAAVPQTAWRQYGNDWAYWKNTFSENAGCVNLPVSQPSFPGLTSAYLTPPGFACPLTNTLLHGFLYVSGNATFQTGGYTSVWGSAYIAGAVNMAGGGYVLYFDPLAAQSILTTRIVLTRTSWQDSLVPWPLP